MAVVYDRMLPALLPPGEALAGDNIKALLSGLAPEYARIDDAIEGLVVEADPTSTEALIDEWEAMVGITDSGGSTFERRAAVLSILLARGGQNKAYYQFLAHSQGYDIEIEEFPIFVAGSSAGDFVVGADFASTFLVIAQEIVGSPVHASTEALEALINKYKPAHTTALFDYEGGA